MRLIGAWSKKVRKELKLPFAKLGEDAAASQGQGPPQKTKDAPTD